ncbi:MAG TPA: isoaspartyl peptidase/L-asparaginase family protein [Azospirillaceae bacterium]|nr:isoaspartyl peptidase/L-asparaginase family protein [Azospirillaceae bacterium]
MTDLSDIDASRAPWVLFLHGGAKEIPPEEERANREGCLKALDAGAKVLRDGGSAVDAVAAALRVLEQEEVFNAGYGSAPNADGEVEMDAAIMDGETLDIGGVAGIRGVRHPSEVARLMLREQPTLLVADGARRFAADKGAELCDPDELLKPEDRKGKPPEKDTVGCVALDPFGHVAAGCSTGGLDGNPPGRVGDTALPGAGLYADDALGAVAFSGDGESICRAMLAAHVMRDLENAGPQEAADAAIARLGRVGGEAGCIVVDRGGRIGWAHNSAHFAVAYASGGTDEARVYLKKDEEEGTP